eukprot:c2942_g1_i1.p1 GENE.c2942_g1_i1~~c2942_g1_i1.p1  ORF type:complete len:296 (-),score=63.33 c2942_g1_i1:107-994(-)
MPNHSEETFPNPFRSSQPKPTTKNKYQDISLTPHAGGDDEEVPFSPAMVAVDMDHSVEELKARERRLMERENLLNMRERALVSSNPNVNDEQANNWPPYFPVVYFSVVDVPVPHQPLIRTAFTYLHIFVMSLVWNFVCNAVAFSITAVIMSIVYLVVGSYVAWHFQFRSLFSALKTEVVKDSRIFVFLMHFVFAVGFNGVMAVGLLCGAGFIPAVEAEKTSARVLFSTGFCLWSFDTLLSLYILRKAIKIWKLSGGQVEKARTDVLNAATHTIASDAASSWASQASRKDATCEIM